MANNFFRFKQFTVYQEICAMKVGTDGVLLGAWAKGGNRILDIGTGTGVVALMMAQRFPDAIVDAVDVDEFAVRQANDSFNRSQFAKRLSVSCISVQRLAQDSQFSGRYDAIVANPPYFRQSLTCPDYSRTMARHAVSLTYEDLFQSVNTLLSNDGSFSVVIPFDCLDSLLSIASEYGFSIIRRCDIRTTPVKAPRRHLLTFSKKRPSQIITEEGIIESSPGVRSDWYSSLMADFYL